MITDDTIITFGKYKGKTVEALLYDEAYLEWLLEQDWLDPDLKYYLITGMNRPVICLIE